MSELPMSIAINLRKPYILAPHTFLYQRRYPCKHLLGRRCGFLMILHHFQKRGLDFQRRLLCPGRVCGCSFPSPRSWIGGLSLSPTCALTQPTHTPRSSPYLPRGASCQGHTGEGCYRLRPTLTRYHGKISLGKPQVPIGIFGNFHYGK